MRKSGCRLTPLCGNGTDDLELLDATARLVAVVLNKNKAYDEMLITNITCGKLESRLSTELAITA